MNVDWNVVATIVAPLLALFVGAWLNRYLERRPKLLSYLGHVSAFTLQDENRTQVYTHSIVVRNGGKKKASNVRIGHNVLPNYKIYPEINFNIVETPNGGREILIPTLIPGEQITISYLYFPPLTWDQINAFTKSDEGFAKILNVLPTPQPPKWVIRLFWFFVFVGVTTCLYFIVQGLGWLIKLKS